MSTLRPKSRPASTPTHTPTSVSKSYSKLCLLQSVAHDQKAAAVTVSTSSRNPDGALIMLEVPTIPRTGEANTLLLSK
jgi:hypothetical protein